MKTSREGLALLARFEGLRLKAYQDSVGVWTIGFGHTSMAGPPAVRKGLEITKQEAMDLLARDIVKYEAGVMRVLKRAPSQGQFDAMVSLCYNIGEGGFAKSSVVKHFNAGNFEAAARAFGAWNKAGGRVLPGLTTRRAMEAALFRKSGPPVAVPAPKPQPTPMPTSPQETGKRGLWGMVVSLFGIGSISTGHQIAIVAGTLLCAGVAVYLLYQFIKKGK